MGKQESPSAAIVQQIRDTQEKMQLDIDIAEADYSEGRMDEAIHRMGGVSGVYDKGIDANELDLSSSKAISLAMREISTTLETAQKRLAFYQQKKQEQPISVPPNPQFDTALADFTSQIECLKKRRQSHPLSADAKIDLDRAIDVARTLEYQLSLLRTEYVGGNIALGEFKTRSMACINQSDVKQILGAPRGDWSVPRILGQCIRMLLHCFGHEMTAPRFFKTTTEIKVGAIEQSILSLD